MFDKIKNDIQDILNVLKNQLKAISRSQELHQLSEIENLSNIIKRLMKINNMIKSIETKNMPEDPQKRATIQNNLNIMQEAVEGIKSDMHLKPIKSTKSIHAKNHSGSNDRLSHILFGQDGNLRPEDLLEPVQVRTDSKGKISVSARLDFENMKELKLPQCVGDAYVRAVLDSVTSLFIAGNSHFTAKQVYYEMTGYNSKVEPDAKVLQDINRAIEILACSRIEIDATNEANAKGYDFKETHFKSYLLPLDGLHVVLMNGVQVDAYEFLKEPVLYSYAKQKEQILTCMVDILALPQKVNLTRDNVILQRYLLERIEGMKNKKNKLGCIILYEAIYAVLNATEATRDDKKRIRKRVRAFLDNWKNLAYIKDWKEESEGRLLRSIRIDLYEN